MPCRCADLKLRMGPRPAWLALSRLGGVLSLVCAVGGAPALAADPTVGSTTAAVGVAVQVEADAAPAGPGGTDPLPPTPAAAPAPTASPAVLPLAPADDPGAPAEPRTPDTPEPGYRWRGPPAAVPDWDGAGRDAAYFVAYQLVGVAAIYTSPASMSGWTKEDKRKFGFDQWQEHVRNPVVWDGDDFVINWVLHPYWGGAYYVRGRERGLNEWQSFGFSALMSTLWEYGAEAIAEPVSVQDLVFTPVLGALVGEYLFQPWREHIRAKPGELDYWDRTVLALTDPLGAINATIDRWFGIQSTVSLQPFVGRAHFGGARRLGVVDPTLAMRPSGRTWGLQLNVRW